MKWEAPFELGYCRGGSVAGREVGFRSVPICIHIPRRIGGLPEQAECTTSTGLPVVLQYPNLNPSIVNVIVGLR
jgi:hypothetical protein